MFAAEKGAHMANNDAAATHVVHTPETDLYLPDPSAGTQWDPMSVFTHAELLSLPGPAISIFCYLRALPAYGMSQGGISIFQGLDNPANLGGVAYLDYNDTAPWPEVTERGFVSPNGLTLEFLEPGSKLRVTYESPDGTTRLDVTQTALTPLLARGHIIPGEDLDSDPAKQPGGSEQFMRCEGELTLHGDTHTIDSTDCRDRSWAQVRSEAANVASQPPLFWSPMHFGEELTFNQVGFENPDTDPLWAGLFEMPEAVPTHFHGWLSKNGELRKIASVHRQVHEYHPDLLTATRQTIRATDDADDEYHFEGEAIAMGAVPAWTNATLRQAMYRWTDQQSGAVAHNSGQEIWLDHRYAAHAARRLAER